MWQIKGIDNLLELNDLKMFYGEQYWVGIQAWVVSPNEHMPHGVRYSLTLHNLYKRHKSGTRILGYDNSHGISVNKKFTVKRVEWDHIHDEEQIIYYDFVDCYKLLNDFWGDVKKKLAVLGVTIA